MFKDYYQILGTNRHASAQEIKNAYRAMSMKWHPDKHPNVDVTSRMQDINEAYAILKNEEKRQRYDIEYDKFFAAYADNSSGSHTSTPPSAEQYTYNYDVEDETLREDMSVAREYAKQMVEEFLRSLEDASRNAVKGAWEGASIYIIGSIIASIIFLLIRMFN